MKTKMKKAFIDKILLGFFLTSTVFVFIATVADDMNARNKYEDLKKIVQTSVLSAAKYYNNIDVYTTEANDSQTAEDIAIGIVRQIPLGQEVIDNYNIDFTWNFTANPNFVTAKIVNYKHDMFWYKLLGLNNFTFDLIEAKANIIALTVEEVDDFVPIAVNGCSQEFETGIDFDFLLKAYDVYDPNDNVGFFALYDPSGGQSSFSHFKNIVDDVMKDKTSTFDMNNDLVSISTVLAEDIENDVKQISQAFNISGFPQKNMSIAVLDCGSTADEPIIKELLPINMKGVYCGKCCSFNGWCMPWPMSMMCNFMDMMDDLTGDVFTDIMWDTEVSTCNNNELFRINFEVLNSNNKVVLEY